MDVETSPTGKSVLNQAQTNPMTSLCMCRKNWWATNSCRNGEDEFLRRAARLGGPDVRSPVANQQALVSASSSTDFIVQMIHKSGLLVALVSLVAHVASKYIMDDRNASISYSPSYTVGQLADSEAYDGTLSAFFCAL